MARVMAFHPHTKHVNVVYISTISPKVNSVHITMTSTNTPEAHAGNYHHGDLKHCLIAIAEDALTRGEALSLRKIARTAGVTPAATYRHFRDKQALESVIAARGYEQLDTILRSRAEHIHSTRDLVDIAHAYADFATAHPAVFQLMFTTECDPNSPERLAAVEQISATCLELVYTAIADSEAVAGDSGNAPTPEALWAAVWAFTHGVTALALEQKLPAATPEQLHATIDSTWEALMQLGQFPTAR